MVANKIPLIGCESDNMVAAKCIRSHSLRELCSLENHAAASFFIFLDFIFIFRDFIPILHVWRSYLPLGDLIYIHSSFFIFGKSSPLSLVTSVSSSIWLQLNLSFFLFVHLLSRISDTQRYSCDEIKNISCKLFQRSAQSSCIGIIIQQSVKYN